MLKLSRITLFITALFVFLILTQGCVKKRVNTNPCPDSLIMDMVNNPSAIGDVVLLANAEALRKGKYTKKQAKVSLTVLKDFLKRDTISFGELVLITRPMIHSVQLGGSSQMDGGFVSDVSVLLISNLFNKIEIDTMINDCDRFLLNTLCDNLLKQCE